MVTPCHDRKLNIKVSWTNPLIPHKLGCAWSKTQGETAILPKRGIKRTQQKPSDLGEHFAPLRKSQAKNSILEKFLVTTLECLRDDEFQVLFIKRYFHTYKISQRIYHSLLKSSKHLPKNPKTLGGKTQNSRKKLNLWGAVSPPEAQTGVKKRACLKGHPGHPWTKAIETCQF